MNQKLPKHVAIVMDGNGRWATHRGLSRVEGHRMGVAAVNLTVEACLKKKIPILSLFTFSTENWSRPVDEVDCLMQLFMESIEREMERLYEQGVRVCFFGDRTQLTEILQTSMQSVETLTASNDCLVLNVMMNYGGRWDIVQAAHALARLAVDGLLAPEDIDEGLFATMLSTHGLPDPDLLIRTSGELRISNFCRWQLAYSALYFSEVYWPDFTVSELEKALDNFASRMRRYGKTSSQEVGVNHV